MPNRRARRRRGSDGASPSQAGSNAGIGWLVLLVILVVGVAVTWRRWIQLFPFHRTPPPIVQPSTPAPPSPVVTGDASSSQPITKDPVTGVTSDTVAHLGMEGFVQEYQKKSGKNDEATTRTAYQTYMDLKNVANMERVAMLTAADRDRYDKLRKALTGINADRLTIANLVGGGTTLVDDNAEVAAQEEDVLGKVVEGLVTPTGTDAKARTKAAGLIKQSEHDMLVMSKSVPTSVAKDRRADYAHDCERIVMNISTVSNTIKDLPDVTAGYVAEFVNYVVHSAYNNEAGGEAP